MQVLGVDTATRSCSVGIVRDNAVVAEEISTVRETHSKHLMPLIVAALRRGGLTLADIDLWAVVRGPGSFTGLRIGLSTVKGLAAATGKPVVGVSSLAVLAFQNRDVAGEKLVCALLDARKSEVYSGWYRFRDGRLTQEAPEAVGKLAAVLGRIDEPCLFVGDGAVCYHDEILAQKGPGGVGDGAGENMIRGTAVAQMALDKVRQGASDDLISLAPNYIRRSDAEIHRCQLPGPPA